MERSPLVLDDDELVGAYIQRAAATVGLNARATRTVRAFHDQLALCAPTDIVLDPQHGADDGVGVLRQLAGRALGRSMGLSTPAEGGETQAALDAIKRLGVDAAQGFLISRPLSLERLLPWLVERREGVAKAVSDVSA